MLRDYPQKATSNWVAVIDSQLTGEQACFTNTKFSALESTPNWFA
jgi:hypothetical protein